MMGWASGSSLMIDVITGLKERGMSLKNRKIVYEVLIPAMQDQDWDTLDEPMGMDEAYEAAMRTINPEWFE